MLHIIEVKTEWITYLAMQAITEYTLFMEITMGLVYHDGNNKESRNAFEHLDVYFRYYIFKETSWTQHILILFNELKVLMKFMFYNAKQESKNSLTTKMSNSKRKQLSIWDET